MPPYEPSPDELDDDRSADETTFERIRKQRDKPATIKDDRRQRGKEFGRAVFKHQKERRKDNGKP